jgi:hypothetical protein
VPSPTDEPHAVVTAGQKFQFEWVTGHNLDTYIILLAKKDAAQMKNHELTMMEAFLKDAACPQTAPPASGSTTTTNTTTLRSSFFGVKDSNGVLPAAVPNFYKRRTLPTEAHFIPRSSAFKKTMKNMRAPAGPKTADVQQFEYKDADVATNRRCVPNNPIAKWPWVIAMHKYRHVRHQPTEADVTWLQFPADTPPGDYIVHYRWRSYYDAMDVRVVAGTTPVANPFGGGAGTTPTGAPVPRFKRIDHCTFFNSTLSAGGSCVKMSVTGGKLAVPDACLERVQGDDDRQVRRCRRCAARQRSVGGAALQEPDQHSVPRRLVRQADRRLDAHVLPGAPGRGHADAELVRRHHRRRGPGVLLHLLPPLGRHQARRLAGPGNTLPYIAADVPDWKANSRCISCADQDKFSKADVTPVWELATSCVNCNLASK